jgi:hypothetical protein
MGEQEYVQDIKVNHNETSIRYHGGPSDAGAWRPLSARCGLLAFSQLGSGPAPSAATAQALLYDSTFVYIYLLLLCIQ